MARLNLISIGSSHNHESLCQDFGVEPCSIKGLDSLNTQIESTQDGWILLLREDEWIEPEDFPRLRHLLQNPIQPVYLLPLRRGKNFRNNYGLRLFHQNARVFFEEPLSKMKFLEGSQLNCEPHRPFLFIRGPENLQLDDLVKDEVIVQSHEVIQKRDPQSWRSRYSQSIALTRLARFDEAIRKLEESHQLNPIHLMTINNLGYNYMVKEDFERSKEYYLKAVAINPEFEIAYSNLGVLHMRWNKLEDAVKYLKKSIEARNDNPMNYYNLGNSLFRLKRVSEAVTYYQKAIAYDPDYEKALSELAMAYLELNDIQSAQDMVHQSLNRDIQFPQTLLNAGIYFVRTKQFNQAKQEFENLLREFPNTPEAQNGQRIIQELQGIA